MKTTPELINVGFDFACAVFKDEPNADYYRNIINQYGELHNYIHRKDGYGYGCAIPLNETGDVLTVLSKDDGSVRFYWNPLRLNLVQETQLRQIICSITEPFFHKLWESNCIQELHLAIDIVNADPDDICGKRDHARKSQIISDHNGKTETVYFGGKNAPTIVYNKALQLIYEWNKMKDDVFRSAKRHFNPPAFQMMRIEERSRLLKRTPRDMLDAPINPFDKLDFYWYSALEKSEIIHKLFTDSCHYRGLKPALARLPDSNREEILDFLNKCEPAFNFVGDLPAEINHAYQKLLVLAPEKKWKAYVKRTPAELYKYRHTGIFTDHLMREAFRDLKRPHVVQMNLLQSDCASKHWKAELIGKPVTRKLAEELILAYQKPSTL